MTATSTTNVVSLTVSTTNSNDVVVIESTYASGTASLSPAIQSVSGGGLTWVAHGTDCLENGPNTRAGELWYAVAASPLSSAAITITYNSGLVSYTDRAVAFGVSGANTTTPFDPNPSIPGCANSSSTPSLTYAASTNSSNDFVVAFSQYSAGTIVCPSGFTAIGTGTGGTCFAYEITASPLSSSNITTSNGTTAPGYLFVDALQAAGGSNCTHSAWLKNGSIAVPTAGSTLVWRKDGSFGTVDCSSVQYYQPTNGGAFGVN